MRKPKLSPSLPRLLAFAALLAVATGGRAETAPAVAFELTPENTAVTFDLAATGHDVHGSIPLERGRIELDPAGARAGGEIVLDPAAAVSGNKSRDKTMRAEVFEAVAFPKIVFRPERLVGELAAEGHSEVSIEGTVSIHGVEKPVSLATAFDIAGGELRAHGTLEVPFVAWGLHDPSIAFLRVAKEVQVVVDVTARLAEGSGAPPAR